MRNRSRYIDSNEAGVTQKLIDTQKEKKNGNFVEMNLVA